MSTDVARPPVRVAEAAPARWQSSARGVDPLALLTSIPVLAACLTTVTLLAAGPMQSYDQRLHRHWSMELTPGMQPFLQQVLDRIAGQTVCLPVLAAVAIVLAWRRRTWRPVVFALLAEGAFYAGVGGMKVLLARPAPTEGETAFMEGGLTQLGAHGISYPSGHAAEAVLIYGAAVYLIARYSSATQRTVRLLTLGVAVITVNSIAVSFYLGWHWATDLVGGVLAGGLCLQLLMMADRRDWRPWRKAPGAESRPTPAAATAERSPSLAA